MSPDTQHHAVVAVLLTALLVGILAVGSVGAMPLDGAASATTFAAQEENEPPVAVLDYSPSNPEPGEAVALDASGSNDPDGEIVEYRWDYDGDGETDAEGGTNRRLSFPSAGTYTVGLTVVDDDGATDTTTVDIQVAGDQPPVARLDVTPSTVPVGEVTELDPTGSSDPDGRIVTWEFDTNGNGTFDETFDSPTTMRRNYAEPGTYEITLRVTDNDGLTATTTVSLTVEPSTPTASASSPDDGPTAGSPTEPEGSPATGPDDGGRDAGPGDGGLLPGSGLAIGLLLVVVALLVAGVVLFARSGTGGGRAPPGSSSPWERGSGGDGIAAGSAVSVVIAVLLVLLLVGLPAYLLDRRYVSPTEGAADVSLALIQLVALALPALLVLVYLLLQFVQHREAQLGIDVGPLSGEGFRWLTFAFAFLGSVLLTLGLATLLLAGTLPSHVTLAAGLILAGITVVPLLLALALVSLALG